MNSPVIDTVQNFIEKAINLSVSDIHLEPIDAGLRVRFRTDGILVTDSTVSEEYAVQVVSRIKVLANMNVAEKRIPQDGQFSFNFKSTEIDLRVSTFPTVNGEKAVIRILDRNSNSLNIESLGFSKDILVNIKSTAKSSSGFFLVTGPTGSGKTTTLHSMLYLVNTEDKNISTLEDPVEYRVEGVSQGHIYPQVGFTFEKGIRALLRQDPDIIMVGEIRDKETAQVSIQAALTGHLVLSTLHTNSAAGALMRLIDMNIEPFLINATVTGILAQRLVRKLCKNCKFEVNPNFQEQKLLEKSGLQLNSFYKSNGCKICYNSGYKGRIGIFELLTITDSLRTLIHNKPVFQEVFKQACLDGMTPILLDAFSKIKDGITSLSEIARVIF